MGERGGAGVRGGGGVGHPRIVFKTVKYGNSIKILFV